MTIELSLSDVTFSFNSQESSMSGEYIENRYLASRLPYLIQLVKSVYPEVDESELIEHAKAGRVPNPFELEKSSEEWKRVLAGLLHGESFTAITELLPTLVAEAVRERRSEDIAKVSELVRAAATALHKALTIIGRVRELRDHTEYLVRRFAILPYSAAVVDRGDDLMFSIAAFLGALESVPKKLRPRLLRIAAENCARMEHHAVALALLEEAERCCAELDQRDPAVASELAEVLAMKGEALRSLDRMEEALNVMLRAEELLRRLAESDKTKLLRLAWLVSAMTRVLSALRRYDEALTKITDVKRTLVPLGDEALHAIARLSIDESELLMEKGQYARALDVAEQTIRDLSKAVGSGRRDLMSVLVHAMIDKAESLLKLSRYDDAERAFSDAEEKCRELVAEGNLGAISLLSRALAGKSECLLKLGRVDEARDAAETAEALGLHLLRFGDLEQASNIARAMRVRAEILASSDRLEEAVRACETYEKMFTDILSAGGTAVARGLAEVLLVKASLMERLGRKSEAEALRKRAMEIARV